MPDKRRRTCRRCGGTVEEVGPISWRGLCTKDAKAAVAENVYTMVAHSGPTWTSWRRGMAASVGGTLIDDTRGQE